MSDHFSGPRAIAGPAGDICDFYAFPSPERPGHVVLVMTVLPAARADAMFSPAITCRFRLRRLSVTDGAFAFGAHEVTVDCTFDPPRHVAGRPAVQVGRCFPPTGAPVEVTVHDGKGGSGAGTRVYAGLRSDPFFIDLAAFQESMRTGRLAFAEPGTNSLAGVNVLGLVVETDFAPIVERLGGSLLGVVAETVTRGPLPVRLERVGRPEIKNVILSWKEHDPVNRDLELRDLYNLEDAFHLGKDYRGAYRARLNANLAAIDRLDGHPDWSLGEHGEHPLTELLLADHLVIDAGLPYADGTFLEIERALLAGRAHTSSGGRPPNDDVMTTLYTLLINADRGPRIDDGVHHATVPASRTFPYLAEPTREPGRSRS